MESPGVKKMTQTKSFPTKRSSKVVDSRSGLIFHNKRKSQVVNLVNRENRKSKKILRKDPWRKSHFWLGVGVIGDLRSGGWLRTALSFIQTDMEEA